MIHGHGCCPFGTAKPLKFDPLKVQRVRCLADASASNGDGTQFARQVSGTGWGFVGHMQTWDK